MNDRFIRALADGLRIGSIEREANMRNYEDAIKYFNSKVINMLDRIES